jgi:5-methyltetrahydropteroyltriglutamate--homocysteine methyltransferase
LSRSATWSAPVDIVTDGEIRRESYSNRFATALEGVDADHPAIIVSRSGYKTPVPHVVGKIRRTSPVERRDIEFLPGRQDDPARPVHHEPTGQQRVL